MSDLFSDPVILLLNNLTLARLNQGLSEEELLCQQQLLRSLNSYHKVCETLHLKQLKALQDEDGVEGTEGSDTS